MGRASFCIGLLLLACIAVSAVEPNRHSLVLYQGQKLMYSTSSPIITITSPPGSAQVVRNTFQQYGQNVALEALRPGEIKLLFEDTSSRVSEVANVVVIDKPTWEIYRRVTGGLTGIDGINVEAIQVAGNRVLITGNVYSASDLEKCRSMEQQRGAQVVCGVRLSSAASVVFPDQPYVPSASAEISEDAPKVTSSSTEGVEGASMWTVLVRFGDVPVMTLGSTNRSLVVGEAGDFVKRLNAAVGDWKTRTDRGTVYPTAFTTYQNGGKFVIGIQWKFDQGTRGDKLVELSADEVQAAANRSSGGIDRLLWWWCAILQDSFRLYELAQRPLKTLPPSGRNDLLELYEKSVQIDSKFDRNGAAADLARSYQLLSLASDKQLFENFAVQPPSEFQAGARQEKR